ncbi:MAG: 50S ribosomal protein L11 methyltransferase [Bacillota bacterium]|nr:50S ribosomal protein L11 methyltransferase [Bacillota bacterium]
MRWLELLFATTHEASELLTDFLSSLGADGVQVQDAAEIREIIADPDSLSYADDAYLEQLDPVVRIKAYFAVFDQGVRCNRNPEEAVWTLYDNSEKHYRPLAELEDFIEQKLSGFAAHLDIGKGYTGWQEVREEDWAENWKQYYQTLHLTPAIVINPSWLDYTPAEGEVVIILDPGSAFGTGTHETTALCAELIDDLLLAGDRVLDLGTGSGILAIIAAKLGASSVEAIDIDALAVGVATENCRINDVAIQVHQGELKNARSGAYDLLIGNIIADVLVALMDQVPPLLAPDGLFIASGIIHDKLELVTEAARTAGLDLIVERERHDWYALVFRRVQLDCNVL